MRLAAALSVLLASSQPHEHAWSDVVHTYNSCQRDLRCKTVCSHRECACSARTAVECGGACEADESCR